MMRSVSRTMVCKTKKNTRSKDKVPDSVWDNNNNNNNNNDDDDDDDDDDNNNNNNIISNVLKCNEVQVAQLWSLS